MKYPEWFKEVYGDYPLVGDMEENNYWKKKYVNSLIHKREEINKKWDTTISNCDCEIQRKFYRSDKARDLSGNDNWIKKMNDEIKFTESIIKKLRIKSNAS